MEWRWTNLSYPHELETVPVLEIGLAAWLAMAAVAAAGSRALFPPPFTSKEAPPAGLYATLPREDEGRTVEQEATYYPNNPEAVKGLRRDITPLEVARHASREDAWIVVREHVYDVTSYISSHPGGWLAMSHHVGKDDCTFVFEAFHPARVHKHLLPSLMIGRLRRDAPLAIGPIDRMAERIRIDLLRRGMYQTDYSYYVRLFAWIASLLGLALYCTLAREPTYYLGAVLMGAYWQQLAFVGHDLGHTAISHHRFSDFYYGAMIGNALMGISLGWWKLNHNVHHVTCNSVEHDPDVQHLPALCVSAEQMKAPFYSTYHMKLFRIDALTRSLVSVQHYLFYPIMCIARLNLYVQSALTVLFQGKGRLDHRWTEGASLLVFACWVPCVAMLPAHAGWQRGLAWILLSHAVSGLLHVQICISHFSCDVHLENDPERETGFYALQLQTTMNVDCLEALDWLHGGLQFQIEHHLYPRLPRHALREARSIVRKSLAEMNKLDVYQEHSFVKANLLLLQTMKRAADAVQTTRLTDGGFYTSVLADGLNARG